jgi:hypothetical protein
VPVTSPARTLADIKSRLTRRQFTRLVSDARREQWLTAGASRALLGYDSGPTRSEFEAAFLRFCRRYGLPTPATLVIVAGYEVDALFAAQRLWSSSTAGNTTATARRSPLTADATRHCWRRAT